MFKNGKGEENVVQDIEMLKNDVNNVTKEKKRKSEHVNYDESLNSPKRLKESNPSPPEDHEESIKTIELDPEQEESIKTTDFDPIN